MTISESIQKYLDTNWTGKAAEPKPETFQQYAERRLLEHGFMLTVHVKQVLDMASSRLQSMSGRWGDLVSAYPPVILTAFRMTLDECMIEFVATLKSDKEWLEEEDKE